MTVRCVVQLCFRRIPNRVKPTGGQGIKPLQGRIHRGYWGHVPPPTAEILINFD